MNIIQVSASKDYKTHFLLVDNSREFMDDSLTRVSDLLDQDNVIATNYLQKKHSHWFINEQQSGSKVHSALKEKENQRKTCTIRMVIWWMGGAGHSITDDTNSA